ncbi:MAG TPA: hypothetical protein VFG04_13185 [Planctomycetaceae bacterium]|nr:hypothetical protein [Planctomycetaceae bacterium]
MLSTLQRLGESLPLIGLSRWMRTDLILAATLLFLIFASWAMLAAAQASHGTRHLAPSPAPTPQATDPSNQASIKRSARRGLGTVSIVLGLLGSFTLLAICAW